MRLFRSKPRKPVAASRINTITVTLQYRQTPNRPWDSLEHWFEFDEEKQAIFERLKALKPNNSRGEYRVVREVTTKEVYK